MNRQRDDMPEAMGWVVCDLVTAITLVAVAAALVFGWMP